MKIKRLLSLLLVLVMLCTLVPVAAFATETVATHRFIGGTSTISDGEDGKWKRTEVKLYLKNGEDGHYYVTPGTTLKLHSTLAGYSRPHWTMNLPAGITSNLANEERAETNTITIGANAAPGTYTQVISHYEGVFDYVARFYIHVVSVQDAINYYVNSNIVDNGRSFSNENVFFVTVLQNSTDVPAEPTVASGYDRYYIHSSTPGGAVTATFKNSGSITPGTSAATYVKSDFYSRDWTRSVDGSATIGIYDPTGVKTKDCVKNINWGSIIDVLATKGNVYASDGVLLTNTNKNGYEVLPYVMKLQTAYSIGWHLDCYVVPKGTVTLSYDVNMPTGISKEGLGVPGSVTDYPDSSSYSFKPTVRNPVADGKNLTVVATPNNSNVSFTADTGHKVWFLGWNTKPDGSGDWYYPDQTISVSKNTVLYAQWQFDPAPDKGYLDVAKNVVTKEGSEPAPDESFSFAVTFSGANAASSYDYTVYNAAGAAVDDGTIANGGNVSIKNGQVARFEAISGTDYTVTENMTTEQAQWYTGDISTKSGSISGRVQQATFTNTYSKYTVTTSATNATIDPSSSYTYDKSATTDVHFAPAEGYVIKSVVVDGAALTGETLEAAIALGMVNVDHMKSHTVAVTAEVGKFYVAHVQGNQIVRTDTHDVAPNFNIVNECSERKLYGGTFTDEACTTPATAADLFNGGKPTGFTPVAGETYYIWEVSPEHLQPKTMSVWTRTNGIYDVKEVYLISAIDRLNYASAGFKITSGETKGLKAGNDIAYAYITVWTDNTNHTYNELTGGGEDTANSKIVCHKLTGFTDAAVQFVPYWVTLDGVTVYGTHQRTIRYNGPGPDQINQKVTVVSNDPYTPGAPDVPDVPAFAARPMMLMSSYNMNGENDAVDVGNLPELPEEPEVPDVPDVPDEPEVPDEPDIPDEPDVPDEPEVPDEPDVPEIAVVKVVDGDKAYDAEIVDGAVALTPAGVSGKLFAGWFTDAACTVPAKLAAVSDGDTVYAKYVSANFLQVKYAAVFTLFNKTVSLTAAVADKNFAETGFVIETKNGTDTVVVSSYAQKFALQNASQLFGAAKDAPLMTVDYKLSGLSKGDTLVITPYWVTADGTTVYGTARTLTYTGLTVKG